MKKITLLILLLSYSVFAQKKNPVYDDFGGQSTINWWSYPSGESEFIPKQTDPRKDSNSVGLFYKNKTGNQQTHHGMGSNFSENFNLRNKTKFSFKLYVSNISAVSRVRDKKVRFILRDSENSDNYAYIEQPFETGKWQTIVFDFEGKLDQSGKPIEKNKDLNTIVIEFLTNTKTPGKFYVDDFTYGDDLKENAD